MFVTIFLVSDLGSSHYNLISYQRILITLKGLTILITLRFPSTLEELYNKIGL